MVDLPYPLSATIVTKTPDDDRVGESYYAVTGARATRSAIIGRTMSATISMQACIAMTHTMDPDFR